MAVTFDRRNLLKGACCLLCPTPAMAASTAPFPICAAIDNDAPPVDLNAVVARLGYGASLDPEKLWTEKDGATPGTGRITLDIAFIGGTQMQHATVRRFARQWLRGPLARRIAFRFGAPVAQSHVRVGFDPHAASTSSVGRDSLDPRHHGLPTVNLSKVDQRDVLHEFGHVLGLKHEHQHPNAGIRWNRPVVIADMWRRAKWSPEMVDENIFKHFSKHCVCIGDDKPDPLSVMLYPIPPTWTLDHRSTRYNTSISKRDRACLEREYGVS